MLEESPVLGKVSHQEIKGIIADPGFPVLRILCAGIVLIVIAEVHADGVSLIVDVPGIVHAQDLPDAEPGLRDQQEEQLVPAVGACLQGGDDFFFACRPYIPFLRLHVAAERPVPQGPLDACRIWHDDLAAGEHPQARRIAAFRHKKIEPEHIL